MSAAVEIEASVDPWVSMADALPETEARAWATGVAARIAGQQGLNADEVELVATAFAALATQPLTEGWAGRLVFVPDVRTGLLLFDVMFVEPASPDSAADQLALLGPAPSCDWVQTDDLREEFALPGVERLWVESVPDGDASVLTAGLLCILRREVRGMGSTDVVLQTASTNIELVFGSLLPTWDLLVGGELFGEPIDEMGEGGLHT